MSIQRNRLRSNNESWLTSYADLITNLMIFFVMIISASSIQSAKMEQIVREITQKTPEDSLYSAAQKVQEELKKQALDKDVSATLTADGLVISFNSGVTFDSGSAAVLPQMEERLQKVFVAIKPYTEKYSVAIEGHTDERPINSGAFQSNWELASARAHAIRQRLEAVGVSPKKMRVESYADTKPLLAETPNSSTKSSTKLQPEGVQPAALTAADREQYFAKQRRVVIRLF